jgi:predicted Zn-dependent peptidase
MQFTKKTLENGLRIISVPMKDNPTATVLVLVEAGSKYETKETSGLSHFLEHMCFKGTTKRPKGIDIAKELDGLGSQYNAFTSHEYTGYYAKSEVRHFTKLTEIIADMYLNSTFPEKEIEKEKGVIVEELNMYEDMPNRHVHDLFMELLYGDQPAGWKIVGNKETIRSFNRDNFVEYHKAQYVPEATTIIVAGGIDDEKVFTEIEKYWGALPVKEKKDKIQIVESQDEPKVLLKYKKTDQTHFVLGVRSYDMYDERDPILEVLGSLLGGGMSSRLFEKLREEMGVGYYVRAYNDAYTDHGFFQVSAGVDNTRISEVISAVINEMKRLVNDKVSEEELSKVKEYISGNLYLEIESSDELATFYGTQEILRKPIKNPLEVTSAIREVTAEDVQRVAREIFVESKLNLALIGPFEDAEEFRKLLKL